MRARIKNTFAAICVAVGFGAAVIGYVGTLFVFFSSDRPLLGLLVLFVPPAEVVLGFVADPILGAMATGGMLLGYTGLALRPE